jgi:hypothetical protein
MYACWPAQVLMLLRTVDLMVIVKRRQLRAQLKERDAKAKAKAD